MHAADIEVYNYQIILYSSSWLFSTFAPAICAQEALEAAEKEFQEHTAQHGVDSGPSAAASAYVVTGSSSRFFKRQAGEWQLAFYPAPDKSGRLVRESALPASDTRQRAAA